MKKTGWIVCRILIEKAGGKSKDSLFSFLSPSLKKHLIDLQPPNSDLTLGFDFTTTLLESIHYSWFTPFLRNLSENDIRLFLSALEETSAKKLKDLLKVSSPLIPLSPLASSFFRKKIAEPFLSQMPELIPLQALPFSRLSTLLTLRPETLRLVSEFLGLHDLAVEIKQIIDTVQLKKIHSLLSKEKEYFLKMLSHKKEPVVFKRMELSRWDGSANTLLNLLFQRGLNRLAKGLFLEDVSFVWYVKHRMNEEDAKIFSSLHKSLEHPKAYSILSDQILEVISFLQKINPPNAL